VRRFDSLLGSFRLCRTAALLGADTRLGGAAGTLRIAFRLSRAAEPLDACLGRAVGLLGAGARLSRAAGLLGAGARLSRAAGPLGNNARLGLARIAQTGVLLGGIACHAWLECSIIGSIMLILWVRCRPSCDIALE
jgi:hypothetical protein